MATDNPRGLVPFRDLKGNPIGNTRRYQVSSDNPSSIFIGDPVELVDGHVRVISTSGVSIGERGVLGVVNGILDTNQRPLTHNLPSQGQFLDASTAGYVDVVDDPDATFIASTDATAAQSMIGQFVRMSAAGANSAVGRSGFLVKLADATNTSVGHRFQIMGIAPSEIADGGIGGAAFANNQDVEVRISDHMFRRSHIVLGKPVSATPS